MSTADNAATKFWLKINCLLTSVGVNTRQWPVILNNFNIFFSRSCNTSVNVYRYSRFAACQQESNRSSHSVLWLYTASSTETPAEVRRTWNSGRFYGVL